MRENTHWLLVLIAAKIPGLTWMKQEKVSTAVFLPHPRRSATNTDHGLMI
jgi:hypothetical protein